MGKGHNEIATLASIIRQGANAILKDVHTALPGIVVSFDPETQLAEVQPAIKRVFREETEDGEILTDVALPVLINVPVVFPRGGGYSLTFPVAAGDECLLVFSERSIDNWHEFGGVRKPTAKRFHDLSDALAVVGLSSKGNKIPSYDANNLQLKKDDGSASVTLKANEADVEAATVIEIKAPLIKLTGNVQITGTVTNAGVDISKTHTHPQGNDSDGDAQVDTGAPS